MIYTQKDSIQVSDFFNEQEFNLHLPIADDETEIIVRQDDIKPCIFLRGSLHLSGLFDRYMDCTVTNFMVQLDQNRLIIWIKDGDKKWKD